MSRFIYILLFVSLSLRLNAQSVYYVQDTSENASASDANAGTNISLPWATWQKAFETADAGDTVKFRGGTWYPTTRAYSSAITQIKPGSAIGNNGTINSPIVYINYPGETPILDCSRIQVNTGNNIGIDLDGATYLEFHGLTVTNVFQEDSGVVVNGIEGNSLGNIRLERMTTHHCSGAGVFLLGYDTAYIVNCDSYHNVDSLTTFGDTPTPGNHGDGFWIMDGGGDGYYYRYSYLTGNRSWDNSDNGFDNSSSKTILHFNNWAWSNGKLSHGDGGAHKLAYTVLDSVEAVIMRNNVSAFNSGGAYTQVNVHGTPFATEYNNISWRDAVGFENTVGDWDADVDSANMIVRNNIAYEPQWDFVGLNTTSQATFKADAYGYPYFVTQDHNTWQQLGESETYYTMVNDTFDVSSADFVTVDSIIIIGELSAPRKSDGSLPDLDSAFQLVEGSDFIDGGVDVGLPYNGLGPDLGPFEYSALGDVESITISAAGDATTIEVNNGTLQMSALVSPDTSLQTVTWSTHSGTGSGTINQSGLVQAVSNGTDTIRATAQDGTGIFDDYILTYSNQNDETVPTVTTTATIGNGTFYIISGGNVISDGGASVTQKGVCWNTTGSPTLSDNYTIDGTGIGSYSTSLTFNRSGVIYYIKAYAINSEGTALGDERQATPLVPSSSIRIGTNGMPRFKNGKPIFN